MLYVLHAPAAADAANLHASPLNNPPAAEEALNGRAVCSVCNSELLENETGFEINFRNEGSITARASGFPASQ